MDQLDGNLYRRYGSRITHDSGNRHACAQARSLPRSFAPSTFRNEWIPPQTSHTKPLSTSTP